MHVQFVPEQTELSLLKLENRILVENSENSVIIRVCHDDLSEGEKVTLIRYLAAEGFISDEFECYRASGWQGTSITWAVDQTLAKEKPIHLRGVDRFMIQLFVSVSILWITQLVLAFFRSAR